MSDDQMLKEKKVLELVREAAQRDAELRKKYQIGTKFRFVHDRLHAMLARLEQNLLALDESQKQSVRKKIEDEVLVYVYLFNAHGINLRSWQNMLLPKIFYEHSVNRPIYTNKKFIELLLKSKNNKLLHGYVTMAIKSSDIIKVPDETEVKDAMGSPVIRVREGSLSFQNVIAFTHNGIDYEVNEKGELVKKEI